MLAASVRRGGGEAGEAHAETQRRREGTHADSHHREATQRTTTIESARGRTRTNAGDERRKGRRADKEADRTEGKEKMEEEEEEARPGRRDGTAGRQLSRTIPLSQFSS